MSTQQAQDLIVRKSVVVDCSPEHAFETFTDRLDTWWPFETHKPGEGMPVSAAFEPRAGGRVYHTMADGKQVEWATVLAWEPPSRLVVDCTSLRETLRPSSRFASCLKAMPLAWSSSTAGGSATGPKAPRRTRATTAAGTLS